MDLVTWGVAVLTVLCLIGFAVRRISQRKHRLVAASQRAAGENAYKISYVTSPVEWSGSSATVLAVKTLTYKQYECLEDARYGFKIVGVTPSERKDVQPHKTRAHGQKTVASLVKHGFLSAGDENTYVITDFGLNALEVCDVRY